MKTEIKTIMPGTPGAEPVIRETPFLRVETISRAESAELSEREKPGPLTHGQNIFYEITPEGIAILRFDRNGSAANIFDGGTLQELDANIRSIETEKDLRGLVLLSAKESIFIAGADLLSLEKMDGAGLDRFIELGQKVFGRIARLGIPTVAAIHGACVGGGYELCLACDYRVATPDRVTRIGLPEVSLGILPAWGGSTRLPRLIGVPAALELILGGKVLPAKQALRRGMIDAIAPREYLLRAALREIGKGKRLPRTSAGNMLPGLLRAPLLGDLARGVMEKQARKKILSRTRGHYPAPMKALEVILASVKTSEEESFRNERSAVAELARTDAARNLLRLFQLQERSKKLRGPVGVTVERSAGSAARLPGRVCVIGAGVMGASIAQWVSARGHEVVLRDIDPGRVAAGMARIGRLYREGVKRRLFTRLEARDGMDRISPMSGEVPLGDVDLVIEAAVEKLDLKMEIFRRLAAASRPDAILATNTSALPLSKIAAGTEHPERVLGLHFFNPVHRMQLVEVVAAPQTSPEVVEAGLRFVQKIGKLPVLVRDSPGFLVNRILLPYMAHAGRLFDEGAAAESIDGCMLEFGMPMGPLRLVDEVGVDISADVAKTLASAFPGRIEAPAILDRMLEAGMLGRKKGSGFYVYPKGGTEKPNPAAARLRGGTRAPSGDSEEMQKQLVLLMVNEAARCLEEGVVEDPRDVDLAMVLGAGFAPFRGGPLAYADACGLRKIATDLAGLAAAGGGERFAPCGLIEEMAAKGKNFHDHRNEIAA